MPLNRPRPLLLASVVGPDEALPALLKGADILDLKDPRDGSLGACLPAVLSAVVALRDARAHGRVAVSAALGDATGLPGTFALAAAGAAACGVDYLKVGLRGFRGDGEAVRFLTGIVEAVRPVASAARVIAVAYAEARSLDCLEPRLLPRVAQDAGASGCLIDTALKDGRTLFDHLDSSTLARFVDECRRRRLLCGLAGSVTELDLTRLVELGPDVIGVRGAICDGGRDGRLDPARLRRFGAALSRARAASTRSATPNRVPARQPDGSPA